ncbi:MAG: hypothetical protein JJU05_03745 [Verrucomicrobia bacterium]|nr:hypothetical protein [Verrucomicrobiota bacterium]MCH8526481.1 hypothetical protein [Kiritimatiellia bacterium]
MSRGSLPGRMGVLLILAAFVWGVFWAFGLQFRGGMTYPPGSTLRADPRGAMILFESLEALPGLRSRRLLDLLHRLEPEPGEVTLVVLNANRDLVRYKPLVEFVEAGGRVVLQPRAQSERRRRDEKEENEEDKDSARPVRELEDEDKWIALDKSLARHLTVRGRRAGADGVAVRTFPDEGAPAWVDWSSGRVFEPGGNREDVRVLYATPEGAVVLGVAEGDGEWLLLADAAPLLNQAMFFEPQTEWLLWALGGRDEVVFWEYPMGIRQPRGIMTLIRQYRLTPLLGVMILVFLLWVWRGALPLLPVLPESEEPERRAQSRLDGLRDLLKRYVPAESILTRCLEEWRADLPRAAANPERLEPLWKTADQQARAPLPKMNRGDRLRERFLILHDDLNPKRTKR